jgi:rhodanese-related sulfurtransferase
MWKKIAIVLILSFGFFSVWAQVKSGAYRTMLRTLLSHSVPEIGIQQAASNNSCVFLDAREPREYEVSHIKGAIPIGFDHFDLSQLPDFNPDTAIVVYCSVGYRSEKIAERLLAAGYRNVSNLYGGLFEWVNQGHPVVNQNGPTQQVHAFSRSWGIWLQRGKKVYR